MNSIAMYGVRGILITSVSTQVTRNATTAMTPNAASPSSHVDPGSVPGMTTPPCAGARRLAPPPFMVAPTGSEGGVLLAPDEGDSWPRSTANLEGQCWPVSLISSLYCDSDTICFEVDFAAARGATCRVTDEAPLVQAVARR
jgi:hypothetical protein